MSFEYLKELYLKAEFEKFVAKCNELEISSLFDNLSDYNQILLLLLKSDVLARYNCIEAQKLKKILKNSLIMKKEQTYSIGTKIIEIIIDSSCSSIDKNDLLNQFIDLDTIFQDLDVDEDKKMLFLRGMFYFYKGNSFSRIPESDSVFNDYEKALEIFDSLRENFWVSRVLNHLGFYLAFTGQEELSLKYRLDSLRIANEKSFTHLQYVGYLNIGYHYYFIGNYEKALTFSFKAKEIHEKMNDLSPNYKPIPAFLQNIGEIYQRMGELDLSLEYLEKVLEIAESKNLIELIADAYSQIGELHRQKGNLDLAEEFLIQGFDTWKNLKNIRNQDILFSKTLFYLARLYLDKNDIESSKRYLAIMEDLEINSPYESTKNMLKYYIPIVKALLLRESNRMRDRVESQNILYDLLANPGFSFDINVFAAILLCESLIEEYKMFNGQYVLEEAQNIVQKIYKMSKIDNAYPTLIQFLILKSKFALLNKQLNESQDYLKQAKQIAEEKKLIELEKKVTVEQTELDEILESDILNSADSSVHLNKSKIESYLKYVGRMINITQIERLKDYKNKQDKD